MPRQVKSTSAAAFTISTPPPPPLPRPVLMPFLRCRLLNPSRLIFMIPLLFLSLVAPSMVPHGRPLASPLLWKIKIARRLNCSTISYHLWNGNARAPCHVFGIFRACAVFAALDLYRSPFWSSIFGRNSSSSLPAPVSGSRGVQGQQGHPLCSRVPPPEYSAHLRRAIGTPRPSHEGDRSWGSPSWGSFGEGVPAAVGGQDFLGPYQSGEYYYPSDPYRPLFPLESQPPRVSDYFGADFDPSFLTSADSEVDFRISGTLIITEGLTPLRLIRRRAPFFSSTWGTFTAM